MEDIKSSARRNCQSNPTAESHKENFHFNEQCLLDNPSVASPSSDFPLERQHPNVETTSLNKTAIQPPMPKGQLLPLPRHATFLFPLSQR